MSTETSISIIWNGDESFVDELKLLLMLIEGSGLILTGLDDDLGGRE